MYSIPGQFGPSFCINDNDNYLRNNSGKSEGWICISFGAQLQHYLSYLHTKGNVYTLLSLFSTKEQTR